MILMDEMIPMRLYSRKQRAYLPFNPANKRKGALITLLTRDFEESIELMQKPFFHNPSYYISYYMDRNVKRYLSRDGMIEIEGEEEDPDEALQEAVMRFKPGNRPVITSYGNANDTRLLNNHFDKKNFDKWYDYFRVRKTSRVYPAVYGFNTLNDMFKAVGPTAIEKHGKVICNSYSSATEIVLLNNSQYTLVNSDGPYDMYCNAAVITYVIHVGFPNATWELANNMATHLSGQDQYLYAKNNYQVTDGIGLAMLIGKYDEKNGRNGMISLARNGTYYDLVQFGGEEFVKRIAGGVSKKIRGESSILESDGTHYDAIRVYKSMDSKDQDYIAHDNRFQQWASNDNCIYRHIEREGLMDVRGFVESYPDMHNSASIVIGVDPRHRGEGIATKMMEQLLKEFPKENPDVECLIWRADAKNKKSQNLAQKFGFKLIRSSSVQNVYRKWLKAENKEFDLIPDDVLDEASLVKWMRKKFEIDTTTTSEKTKLRSLKDIVHSKKITNLESGYIVYTALKKMGLACAITLFCEHNSTVDSVGDVYPMVLHTYDDWNTTYIIDPFSKDVKSGIAMISKFDKYFSYGETLHKNGRWGDYQTKPYVFAYNPYDEELKAGNLVYKDIIKVQNMTESAILEFSTNNPLSPPDTTNHKMPMSIDRFKKVPIDDKIIEKYSPYMNGLHHVRTTNSCTGYIWIDTKERYRATNINKPVCYYSVQRKKDENSDSGHVVWLQGIEVNSDYEDRGLAKQMLDIVIRDEGVTNISVDKDNEVAIRLYSSRGFKPYVTNGQMVFMQIPIKHETVYLSPNDKGVMMFEGQLFVFTEELSQSAYNTKLRQYLYKDRIKSVGRQMEIYNEVKAKCLVIRKTFAKPQMYKGLNCFIDLSYYHKLFLDNNQTVRDVAVKFYWEYLNRMLEGTDPYFRDNYVKNTIFVPVTKKSWPVKPDTYVYDWKENLNPISLIFRMIRRNPEQLSTWKKYNFIFVGMNGYFRVDFSRFELKNLVRFKKNLEKLYNGEPIETDEEEDGYNTGSMAVSQVSDTSSSAGITALVVDKIEKSSGIEINDISAAVTNNTQKVEEVPVTGKSIAIPVMKIQNSTIHTPDNDVGIALLVPDDNDVIDTIKGNRDLITTTMMNYWSK